MANTDEKNQIKDQVAPQGVGNLDMVIAFDTTGSMAAYIDDVRDQVKRMIPSLFADNPDLRLGIVAFGDYCDMLGYNEFGNAYQSLPLTDNENDIIRFVTESKNTSGGDGDEFYELVLRKIIDEMPWREDSTKAVLLIADAYPHPIGYSFGNYVTNNQIDWRKEASRAAEMNIKIDTVSIAGADWYKELAEMTGGICIPFRSSGKTSTMVETAARAHSARAYAERGHYDKFHSIRGKMRDVVEPLACDSEVSRIFEAFDDSLDKFEDPEEK